MTQSSSLPPLPQASDVTSERVLVVIPTLNEGAHIANCLQSLLSGDGLEQLQVIVVDGGSTDDTRLIVQDLASADSRLALLDNPARDQANGVNLGAQSGDPSRDILIRCDAHATYPSGFILGVAQTLIARDADSVVVPMDAVAEGDAPAFARANAFIVDTPLGSGGSAHRGGTHTGWIDHGHHAGFRRKKFLQIGGYDPAMIGNEDAEYDTRLAKAGGRIWMEASLRMKYHPRSTVGGLFRQYRRYGAARARHLVRHRTWPKFRQLLPVFHVIALLGSLAMMGLTWWALAYPVFYLAILLMVMVASIIASKDGAMIRTPLALGVMHFAWGIGFLAEALRGAAKP